MKLILNILLLISSASTLALAENETKLYLLGENHYDNLAINIGTLLNKECFEKKIYYLHEGVIRDEINEYSFFRDKDITEEIRKSNYCFGMEEAISYHMTAATIAYSSTFSEKETALGWKRTIIVSRFKHPTFNAIFKYLRKNGSEKTKNLIGNINDELLNLNYRGINEQGYDHIIDNLSYTLVESFGTNEEWLAFLKGYLELLWPHGVTLREFDNHMNADYLEDLFSRETISEIDHFFDNVWHDLAIDLRNVFMADNISKLYTEAKEKGVNLAASIGALHIEGIKKILIDTGISEEEIVVIDTDDKEQIAGIVYGTIAKQEKEEESSEDVVGQKEGEKEVCEEESNKSENRKYANSTASS